MSQHNIRSQSLASAAPLPRAWLDTIAPGTRAFFGIVFLVWSWISTVIILGRLLAPVLTSSPIPGIGDRYIVALGVAMLVSLAEFVSSDRWPGTYWAVLLIADASFTTWQTHTWLELIVQPHTALTVGVQAAIWIASLLGGIIAARFGEELLFGKRRR
jgi:hypothetical protein